ncbi:unnamed protein product [Ranitomeya imitator]|uniref:Testis-expressed protein 2 n=1 Tax=Ranitomeya imitator TaxID=111125 RepID=A0ABN9M8E3_9NEOB|nr:unnamed protein product [Ranitomeya imitator]
MLQFSLPTLLPTAMPPTEAPGQPGPFSAVPLPLSSSHSSLASPSASPPSEQKPFLVSSPSKVLALSTAVPAISGPKPFLSLVKSLSTEVEPREAVAPTRHRQLMKTLVKSLSTDTSKQEFTQPRGNGGDSKTAPSSPITSPSDGRSFFKVTEVEAKIEDTKRRFSEVIYEPFQLLSKIMGDESSSYRSKALSSSASELSSLSNLNGHLEANNNNYSIKEEDGDDECTTGQEKEAGNRGPALALDSCSLSALVSKEDEEFTELYSEDFDFEDEEAVEAPEEAAGVCGTADDEVTWKACVWEWLSASWPPSPSFGFFASPRSSRGRLCRRETPAEPLSIAEPDIWKGWMNEIQSYDPETYHATLTQSVYVRLEGAMLRLSKPNKNVSRRATFNEAKPDVTYISQKIYDLTDCKVHLVPHSLARKRLWNKKYPICLELGRQEDFMSKAQREKETTDEDKEETLAEGGSQQDGGKSSTGRNTMGGRDQVLYLFGRTGREKEEWFHRLLLASRMKSDMKKALRSGPLLAHSRQGSQSGILTHSRSSSKGSMDEVLSQVRTKELPTGVRQKVLMDYSVYMAQCIPQEEPSPGESPVTSANSSPTAAKKGVSGQVGTEQAVLAERVVLAQQAWVNALLGRMFWDFLGEKYWSDLVSKKIQMKLSKIKLPYFMNELTLTELDMGCLCRKSSRPSSQPSTTEVAHSPL